MGSSNTHPPFERLSVNLKQITSNELLDSIYPYVVGSQGIVHSDRTTKACKSISYSRVLDEKKVGRGIIFGFWVFTSIITPFLPVVGP